MTYRENYERWLASDKVDEATKAELRAIADNDESSKFKNTATFYGFRYTVNRYDSFGKIECRCINSSQSIPSSS